MLRRTMSKLMTRWARCNKRPNGVSKRFGETLALAPLDLTVPAALLALAAQGLFELAERWVVPRGLRIGRS